MGRCWKNRFLNNTPAMLGLKRCHGGIKASGILWKPCRYLAKCLGTSTEQWTVEYWKSLTDDERQQIIAKRNYA